VDEQDCVRDGEVHLQVGRSAGHIFHGQLDHPTSTVPSSTSPPPGSDFTTIPSSSGFDQDPDGSMEMIWNGGACPWSLAALPGQRIRLRVIAVDPWEDPLSGSESHNLVGGTDTCPETLLIHDSVLVSTVRLPVCRGRQRDSQIYLSIGHRLSIRVEQSGIRVMRPGKTDDQRHHSPPPTNTAYSRRSGFLLTYECQ